MQKKIRRIISSSLIIILFISLFICNISSESANAASGFKIYDYLTKKTTLYEGVSPIYIYDGNVIGLSKTPAIINERGVALASCTTIFRDIAGLKYSYSSSKKRIILKNKNIKLVMYLGSETAYINGEPVTMNSAPMRVKYKKSGSKCNLVPTRFVAETFGLSYTWNSADSTVNIKTPFKIAYDGKDYDYFGSLGSVMYNDKTVKLKGSPSIIISDNAMLRAKKVFNDAMGVNYKYDSSTGKITFKAGEICLEMTVGSTVAYFNGLIRASEVPPRFITMRDTGKEYLYVPGRFVAEMLGFKYDWNYSTSTSEIHYTDNVGVLPETEELIYESTDIISDDIKPVTYFDWTTDPAYIHEVESASVIDNRDIGLGNSPYLSSITSIYKEELPYSYEVYHVVFSSPITELIQYQYNKMIRFKAYSTYSDINSYYLNGSLVTDIKAVYNEELQYTEIDFNLNSDSNFYSMKMNSDNTVMTVTVYQNYITNITGGHNAKGEYLSINCTRTPVVDIAENDGYLTLTLDNVTDAVSDNIYSSSEYNEINFCSLVSDYQNSSVITVKLPDNMPYYYSYFDDGEYIIYFSENEYTVSDEEEEDSIALLPISIPVPAGIDMNMIEIEDNFYQKQITFKLDGDYRNFYENNPIHNTHGMIEKITVSYFSSGYTLITLQASRVQSFKTSFMNSILTVELANPRDMYRKIIILDAGHGGTDPGTVHGGYNEKDVNFSIIYNYAKELFDNSDIKVYYSRYDDTLIPLATRAELADEVGADLFISVHHNSNNNSLISGTSVYYSSKNTGTLNGLTSKTMADVFLGMLTQSLRTENRGSIDKGYVVVRDNSVPAVLLEIAFMSNPDELARIIEPDFQKKTAEIIFTTVNELFNAYPTGR